MSLSSNTHMSPFHAKRVVWLFALGLVVFYTPYASLSKAVTAGLIPGVPLGLIGLEILPASILGTVFTVPLIITIAGWWKYASFRRIGGIPLPVTTPAIALSGFGLALIIGSTTLAYTFKGISIVLALLLMRGGLLIMGPLIDTAFGRRVRWFSWVALAITFAALTVSLGAAKDVSLPLPAALNLAIYLTGYALRTPCMTKFAKVKDPDVTRRYFVQEVLVTITLLPVIPLAIALTGAGPVAIALRRGFTTFWTVHHAAVLPVVMIGVFYASHNIFGTLIYLDRRENTFCVPLFCGASLLSGFASVWLLSVLFGFPAPPSSQLVSSAMIVMALLFLSPAHHLVERLWTSDLKGALVAAPASGPRFILFVCSGNTCRSPMAAAIANAEIALRLGNDAGVLAASAGLTAKTGSPMTAESHEALDALAVSPRLPHVARPLTRELVDEAYAIYTMTRAQRDALIARFSAAAAKTRCVDLDGDIDDPIGQPAGVYAEVAGRLRELVRRRFDELGIAPFTTGAAEPSSI